MKATITQNYPHELLRDKDAQVVNCRETELGDYEYKIKYTEPGMAINKWIDEEFVALKF